MKKLLLCILLCVAAIPASADKLVILHTNDTHSQIDPADDGLGGVGRRKVLIDSVRAANENVLLVDAGDIVQGSLFFNIYKGEVEEKIMNALGYDLRILGNHEFDNGIEALASNLANANAILLASNYQTKGTPLDSLFYPYAIYDIKGKRVAFMPINLDPHGMIDINNFPGMGYVDAIETANNMAWYLRNIGQADIVVALTHIGYKPANGPGDVALAKASKDIDVIIGGHSHTYLNPDDPNSDPVRIKNAEGRDVLIAQTGKAGRYLGEITIDLDDLTTPPTSRLIRVDSRLDSLVDGTIEEIIAPYRASVDEILSRKVAKTAKRLEKDSPELLNFVSDWVADRGRQLTDNVDFAILNKGGLRTSLPKGDITEGQVITVLPFFNRVQVIEIKGDELLKAFDVMARANGNGVSSEVYAEYDPDTDKCLKVTVNGKPIDPNETYRVASIDYLINGGDYMTPLTTGNIVASSENFMFEDMLDYLKNGKYKNKTINPSAKVRMKPVK